MALASGSRVTCQELSVWIHGIMNEALRDISAEAAMTARWWEEASAVQRASSLELTLTFLQQLYARSRLRAPPALRTQQTQSSSFQRGPSHRTMAVLIRNEVFTCFVFYGVLLVMKMYVIAIITGQVRLRKKAFANPEDALRHGGLQYHRDDSYVERCRRAHFNDMENILPFLFLGAVYSMTGPCLSVARLHFMVFFVARMLHTAAYLLALRAPTRSVAYIIAQIPCVSMALQILIAVAQYA